MMANHTSISSVSPIVIFLVVPHLSTTLLPLLLAFFTVGIAQPWFPGSLGHMVP